MSALSTRAGQRGVALITAVLIVALATILATKIGFDSALEQRRSAGIMLVDQGFQVALGAEAWAAKYLRDDFADAPDVDHLAERWATPIPPIPIDGGQLEGSLEDLNGKFNLNSLREGGTGRPDAEGIREFQNLLVLLELEPKWADVLADWLDGDTQPNSEGAEDSVYLSQAPPYRAANMPITSVSELLALPGFGLERYQRLRPYVAALPVGTRINVCTAPGLVLDALMETNHKEYSLDTELLARQREEGCHPRLTAFQGTLPPAIAQSVQTRIGEQSQYFALRAFITIGTSEFTLYSLLLRENGPVRPIMRNFGAE
jgi:general secretion pathway protein K